MAVLFSLLAGCSESDAQFQTISKFKVWRIDESQELRFNSDKVTARFSARIDYNLGDFHFVSDQRGYAVGVGAVVGQYPIFYATDDGGENWSRKPLQIGWNPMGIAFRNEREGIITTHDVTGCPRNCLNKTITLNTIDRGTTWSFVEHKNLEGHLLNPTVDRHGNYYAALNFLKLEFGTNKTSQSIQIVKSVDSGLSWSVFFESSELAYQANKFQVVGETVFIPTGNSSITKVDAESNQKGVIETGYEHMQDYIAVSDDIIYSVVHWEDGGALIRTTDGGQSWDVLRQDWPQLIAARSVDKAVIILTKGVQPGAADTAGSVASVAYTGDGGRTWIESEMVDYFGSHQRSHSSTSDRDSVLLHDRIFTVLTGVNNR